MNTEVVRQAVKAGYLLATLVQLDYLVLFYLTERLYDEARWVLS